MEKIFPKQQVARTIILLKSFENSTSSTCIYFYSSIDDGGFQIVSHENSSTNTNLVAGGGIIPTVEFKQLS